VPTQGDDSDQDLSYPDTRAARDRWIRELRPARSAIDPTRPAGYFVEPERNAEGSIERILAILLTSRECPWKCVFCDLWKQTFERAVKPGDIPKQIARALNDPFVCRAAPRQIKLYNAGSFFDAGAIPPMDHSVIAEQVRAFSRVIVESHPALVGDRCWRFRDELARRRDAPSDAPLEVAMGLETAHEAVLEKLNKGVRLGDFVRAAEAMGREKVAWRAFILVHPPFEDPAMAVEWAVRSASFAFDHGADVVSLIAVREGNGALEVLRQRGQFSQATLPALEAAMAGALGLKRGRVFGDTWDLPRRGSCAGCFTLRRERLQQMNLRQIVLPKADCPNCSA
jgi:radical SAM enzyme (TIGR01210 family)